MFGGLEDDLNAAILESAQLSGVSEPKRVENRAKKVPEAEVIENVKKTVKSGFKWIVEAYDDLAEYEGSTVQAIIIEIIKSHKISELALAN